LRRRLREGGTRNAECCRQDQPPQADRSRHLDGRIDHRRLTDLLLADVNVSFRAPIEIRIDGLDLWCVADIIQWHRLSLLLRLSVGVERDPPIAHSRWCERSLNDRRAAKQISSGDCRGAAADDTFDEGASRN